MLLFLFHQICRLTSSLSYFSFTRYRCPRTFFTDTPRLPEAWVSSKLIWAAIRLALTMSLSKVRLEAHYYPHDTGRAAEAFKVLSNWPKLHCPKRWAGFRPDPSHSMSQGSLSSCPDPARCCGPGDETVEEGWGWGNGRLSWLFSLLLQRGGVYSLSSLHFLVSGAWT